MTFTKQNLAAMLKRAAVVIEAEHEGLSRLDAATGDGDHGVTINRTMQAVNAAVTGYADLPLDQFIKNIAVKVMMCDGGSTSPLLGSYFMGLASAAPSDELDYQQAAAFFEAGLKSFYSISKAEPGDKTMMDALRPATETLAAGLRAGNSLKESFAAAAAAAAEGAEKTKAYVAKFGRARTMGARAIGHLDAGAASISHIFRAFAEAL
jgi:dihydroxyacetone kinase-like protein